MQEPKPEIPQSPQSPTPDLQAVTVAYGDILEHNSNHTGFGAMFSGILKGMMGSGDIIDLDNQEPSTLKSAEDVPLHI